jgi:hypothetical protein
VTDARREPQFTMDAAKYAHTYQGCQGIQNWSHETPMLDAPNGRLSYRCDHCDALIMARKYGNRDGDFDFIKD